MTEGRTRLDRRLRSLGPDILAGDFDERSFLRRLREDDPTRGVGDALLDQRNLAGIGNLWKSKACFLAGVDPWRPLALVEDEEALRILRVARPLMQASARADTRRSARAATGAITTSPADGGTWVYGRTGRPCPRCGTAVRSGRQGETARATYWCPACQR